MNQDVTYVVHGSEFQELLKDFLGRNETDFFLYNFYRLRTGDARTSFTEINRRGFGAHFLHSTIFLQEINENEEIDYFQVSCQVTPKIYIIARKLHFVIIITSIICLLSPSFLIFMKCLNCRRTPQSKKSGRSSKIK